MRLHSVFALSDLLNILKEAGKIDDAVMDSVLKYISATQVPTKGNANWIS